MTRESEHWSGTFLRGTALEFQASFECKFVSGGEARVGDPNRAIAGRRHRAGHASDLRDVGVTPLD
jgi:hypothetical protein